MSLIFLFVDGIGLGEIGQSNPFTSNRLPSFEWLTGDQPLTASSRPFEKEEHVFTSLDACLGMDGLPQSGTGQVTLFTGVNAAAELGKHFGPFPHSKIRHLLNGKSIFKRFHEKKASCYFMNAFPQVFFDYAEQKNRWSTTTLMTRNAGLQLNSINEILREKAVTAEITQEAWRNRLSLDVPVISEETAADRVINAADKYDFVLLEYYLTDKAGHDRIPDFASEVLDKLDRLLLSLIKSAGPKGHTLLLTSDHGNLEDLSTRSHTRNRVPFFVTGKGAAIFSKAETIQDVTPLCMEWLESF